MWLLPAILDGCGYACYFTEALPPTASCPNTAGRCSNVKCTHEKLSLWQICQALRCQLLQTSLFAHIFVICLNQHACTQPSTQFQHWAGDHNFSININCINGHS